MSYLSGQTALTSQQKLTGSRRGVRVSACGSHFVFPQLSGLLTTPDMECLLLIIKVTYFFFNRQELLGASSSVFAATFFL